MKTSIFRSAAISGALLLVTLLAMTILNLACNRTSSDIAGTYVGNYFGGQETFTLKADGTFVQQFVLNRKTLYQNRGGWSLAGNKVQFTNFIAALPYFKEQQSQENLKPLDSFNGTIPVGGKVIVFYDDAGYFVRKR